MDFQEKEKINFARTTKDAPIFRAKLHFQEATDIEVGKHFGLKKIYVEESSYRNGRGITKIFRDIEEVIEYLTEKYGGSNLKDKWDEFWRE